MAVLKLRRLEHLGPGDRARTWGELPACLSGRVPRLDQGELPSVAEARSRIERPGFEPTGRRTRRSAEGGGR